MRKLAVFASGSGSNFEAIVKACKKKLINGEVVFVLYDRKNAFVSERAKRLGIKSIYLNPNDFSSKDAYEDEIIYHLTINKIELVCLAGYMRIISMKLILAYLDRIINIHPSLLPAFKGKDAIADAYNYPVKITGVSVHHVVLEVDGGKIIAQKALIIKKDESLESLTKRIHRIEHQLYPLAINKILEEI
ncbi:MAG: phosphoribosylglycinamide formyltransferase [Erysipelotrichales bacterium]|nr:phosphoribosylglycinamide formyltransferase [Erysipelotrichales bacterium]